MPHFSETPGFTPNPGAQSDFFNKMYRGIHDKVFDVPTSNRESIEEKLDRIIELLEPRKSTLIVGQDAINEFKKLK